MKPYPLHLVPRLMPKVWGGRRLMHVLGKELPDDRPYGESWELSTRSEGASIIARGPLAGRELATVLETNPAAWMGSAVAERYGSRCPLLFKYIHARERLSLQVHPSDVQAAHAGHRDPGKTEAWIVLEAEPGAQVAHGLRPGTTEAELVRSLSDGSLEEYLRFVTVKEGDVILLPAGTVHTIGGGILLAEVQQNSNLTYRLHDWGRAGMDGRPRPLHLNAALSVLAFPAPPFPPNLYLSGWPAGARDMGPFRFEIHSASHRVRLDLPTDRFAMLALLCGSGRLRRNGEDPLELRAGETLFLPPTAEPTEWHGADQPRALVAWPTEESAG